MLLRRLLFVAVIIFLEESQGLQLGLTTSLSFVMLLLLLKCQPYKEKAQNYMEVFNECCFLFSCFAFVPFTDQYSLDSNVKINMGYLPIALSLLLLLVNFLFMVYKQIITIKIKIQHYLR